MEDFLCKHCGHRLEWVDTYDSEGGIMEGYYIERQLWVCEHCQKSYIIQQRSELDNPIIEKFEKN